MLFGMKIMGFVGVILAIPFAVIVSLMFEDQLNKNE
jgi:predicted PurR-regulated permease PerM